MRLPGPNLNLDRTSVRFNRFRFRTSVQNRTSASLNRSEADAIHTHLLVCLSLQLHSSIKSDYFMIYMKHYAWIRMKRKAPNLYMICVGSVNHSLLVTNVKYKQIRTTCLLPPDDATSCPRRYETKISLF